MRNGIVENWRRGHSEKPTVPAAPSVFVVDDEVGDVGGAVAPHAAHIKGIERLGILHHQLKPSGFAQSLGIERDFEYRTGFSVPGGRKSQLPKTRLFRSYPEPQSL